MKFFSKVELYPYPGRCPYCKNDNITRNYHKAKATKRRIVFWVILAFFALFTVPLFVDIFRGAFNVAKINDWIQVVFCILLSILLFWLYKSIKKFEKYPHKFETCNDCQKEWGVKNSQIIPENK